MCICVNFNHVNIRKQHADLNRKLELSTLTMSLDEPKVKSENGVQIEVPINRKQGELLKYYNASLRIMREVVLCTLALEAQQSKKPLLCLDAVAASGITGLQWKKYLGDKVFVIASDRHSDGCQTNSKINDVKFSPWELDPARTGEYPEFQQDADEIHGCSYTGPVVLHHESFNFVYLQPNGNIAPYLDSVFIHLSQGGVACLLSPNIASQCFRSPLLIQRLYQAHVQKTDYVKELAVRLLVCNIASAAARHGRGIQVLFCISAEDHFLLVVKATKSTQAAVECMSQCRQVLHCLMCEERSILPDVHCPQEKPYSLLSCDCNSKNPGKTAVILGPVWTGSIFSHQYIKSVLNETKNLFKDSKINTILETLLVEAKCSNKYCPVVSEKDHDKTKTSQNDGAKRPASESVVVDGDLAKKPRLEEGDQVSKRTEVLDTEGSKQDEIVEGGDVKAKCNKSDIYSPEDIASGIKNGADKEPDENDEQFGDTPVFYYNLHRMRYQNLPKLDEVITKMKKAGYRASRTHFEANCMRTNATGNQIQAEIDKLRTSH